MLRRHILPRPDLGSFGLVGAGVDHTIGVCDGRGLSGMPGWFAVTLGGSLRRALVEPSSAQARFSRSMATAAHPARPTPRPRVGELEQHAIACVARHKIRNSR